jgi:WD40 repeat protein
MSRLAASLGLGALVILPFARAYEGGKNSDSQGDPLPAGAISRLGTIRFRALGSLVDVAVSPDGKRIASCTDHGGVQLWDPATGQVMKTLREPDPQVRLDRIAFSPDGNTLAAVGAGNKLRFWDVRTGEETAVKAPFPDIAVCFCQAIAFSRDGQFLATAYRGGNVLLWDASERTLLYKLKDNPDDIHALAFSPDSRTLAVGGLADDRTAALILRNVESPKEIRKLWDPTAVKDPKQVNNHEYGIGALAFSPDGKTLVAGGEGSQTIRFWDLEKSEPARVVRTNGWCHSLAFSRDGRLLASGVGTSVQLRRPDTGEVAWQSHQPDYIYSLAFSPDAKTLAFGCFRQRAVGLLRTSDGEPALDLVGHTCEVEAVRFSPDGKTLATGGDGVLGKGLLFLWDVASAKPLRSLKSTSEGGGLTPCKIAFAPDGGALAGMYCDVGVGDSVELYDPSTLKSIRRWRASLSPTSAMAYSPDGEVIAVSSPPGLYLYSVAEGEEMCRLRQGDSFGVAFSPDGRTLAVGCPHGSLELWDWRRGVAVGRIEKAQEGAVSRVRYSPDGHLLATCGGVGFNSRLQDSVAHVWEAATGALVRDFKGDNESVMAIDFSRDGRIVATAGAKDQTIRLWNAFTGKELAAFEGHAGAVLSLDFSPDGKTLASGSADTTALLWDVSHLKADPPADDADDKRLAALWDDLGDKDAGRAYAAVWALVGVGDRAAALFKDRLRPVPEPDDRRVGRLITDLSSEDFGVREAATEELSRYERTVEETLRAAREKGSDSEAKQRLEALLGRFQVGRQDAYRLRQGRAVVVLEHLGTPAARTVLEALAGGAKAADLTRDARSALERLRRAGKGS